MVDRGRYRIDEDVICQDTDLSDQDVNVTHLDKEDFQEEDAVIILRGTILRPKEDFPGFQIRTKIITTTWIRQQFDQLVQLQQVQPHQLNKFSQRTIHLFKENDVTGQEFKDFALCEVVEDNNEVVNPDNFTS